MSKGSTPDTPDYTALANQQAQGNLQMAQYATQANRPTQITPYGTISWDNGSSFDQNAYDQAMQAYQKSLASYNTQPISPSYSRQGPIGGDQDFGPLGGSYQPTVSRGPAPTAPNPQDFYTGGNNWTEKITLSPEMQALFDQNNKIQQGLFNAQDAALGRVNSTMSQPFDTSSLPAMGTVYDPTKDTNNATNLIMQRTNPLLDQQQTKLETQLANQGIMRGSQAWNQAMAQNQYGRNDAYTQAALQGIDLGMQQQGLQYNQQTQNRQNALRLASYLRSLPLNELNALRTGNQVTMPQFGGFSQEATTAGPDLTSAATNTYNANLANANAQNASSAQTLGGLFSLGGTLLSAPSTSILGGLFRRGA